MFNKKAKKFLKTLTRDERDKLEVKIDYFVLNGAFMYEDVAEWNDKDLETFYKNVFDKK